MRARRAPAPLLALPAFLAACGPEPTLPPPACDVLLVSLDTVRADVLTFADAKIAPNLTALAQRGVVFDQAIAGSSWTLPSHVELFTGLPGALHGVHDDGLAIDPKHETLVEHLDARGCFTAGVWSGWYLAGAYGFGRGFDSYECALGASPDADRQLATSLHQGGQAAYWAGDLRAAASHTDVSSERVVDRAIAALERAQPAEPLLLFTHLFDPHYDFVPPPPFDTLLDPDYRGTLDGRDYWRNTRIFDPRRSPARVVGDRDLEHLRALYAGEVAWCDAQLGRLLDALEAAGRLERTLVIVTADHGEEFFEHGNRGHKQTLYDEVLRVPLLIVPPKLAPDRARRGTRSSVQVSLADLAPTVLDYTGGDAQRMWGRSLRAVIEGEALEPRAVSASLGLQVPGRDGPTLRLLEVLRTPEAKLVRRVRLDSKGRPAAVEDVEWFDLVRDPAETLDPAPEDRDAVRAAWARMERHQAELRAFAKSLPHSSAAARRTDVREIFSSELEALGYADGGAPDETSGSWPAQPFGALELPENAVRRRSEW